MFLEVTPRHAMADLAIFLNEKRLFDQISIDYLLISTKNGITSRENHANLIHANLCHKAKWRKFVKKTGKSDEAH